VHKAELSLRQVQFEVEDENVVSSIVARWMTIAARSTVLVVIGDDGLEEWLVHLPRLIDCGSESFGGHDKGVPGSAVVVVGV
jgi:hypothetical protein